MVEGLQNQAFVDFLLIVTYFFIDLIFPDYFYSWGFLFPYPQRNNITYNMPLQILYIVSMSQIITIFAT